MADHHPLPTDGLPGATVEQQKAMARAASARLAAALDPQPDLLGLPVNCAVQALRDARGPGRPLGARNRRSEDAARYLIEVIGDPLLMLAQIAVMPANELAAAAGFTIAAALAEKRLAAVAVLPYVHQRQPLAVNVSGKQTVTLIISDSITGAIDQAADRVVDIVSFQDVSDAVADDV